MKLMVRLITWAVPLGLRLDTWCRWQLFENECECVGCHFKQAFAFCYEVCLLQSVALNDITDRLTSHKEK